MPAVDISYMLTSVPIAITYKLPSGDHSKQDTALPFPVRFLKTMKGTKYFFTEYHLKFYNFANTVFIHAMYKLGKAHSMHGEMRDAWKILDAEPEGKRPL
jgi:hypothetical protein